VVNDRQPYSLTVESRQVVETLCIFFRRGFVEDVARAISRPDGDLLADPWKTETIEFQERLHVDGRRLTPLLQALQQEREEGLVWRLAERLVEQHRETRDRAARLPGAKAATRAELCRRVQRGRNVMEGSLAEPLELQRVAREAALSPYHFHRAFTQLFGETPHGYLTRRRMERACELLASTGMPVLDVCLACGYQSLGSFTSLFRKRTGVPPAQFRHAQK
jgi:AraC-like DNA-binding protein